MTDAPILPDVLQPGLRLVFCGTAAGRRSATERAYYAHPGNLFWRTLCDIGLTPHLFAPADYPQLLPLGIGLTDLAKHHVGNDAELPREAFDAPGLHQRILTFAPRMLAFTSKHAARVALGLPCGYGLQPHTIGATRLWVLPSPSGQARGHWQPAVWQALGEWFRQDAHARPFRRGAKPTPASRS